MRQKKWDEYEVALLIESVNKIKRDGGVRSNELRALSNLLRKRAKNLGMIIDDQFRNYNGMSLQAAAIESLLFENESRRNHSRLFNDMVIMFKTNYDRYNSILIEAHYQSD